MKKYIITETETLIQGDTYCELLEEYRKATGDRRTYKDLMDKFPEHVQLITDQNQEFKTEQESECFITIKILESLKIIKKLSI
jgi:hypothetical protein